MSKEHHNQDGKWYEDEIYGLAEHWEGQPFCVTYGYDGGVSWPADPWDDRDPPGAHHPYDLTADDMRDLADMMIDRWTRFRASLAADKKIYNENLPGKYEDQDSEL